MDPKWTRCETMTEWYTVIDGKCPQGKGHPEWFREFNRVYVEKIHTMTKDDECLDQNGFQEWRVTVEESERFRVSGF